MENNQLQIVSFEQAQRLKKLGFDWECDSCYWEDGEVDYHGNNNWNNVHPFSGIDEEIFSAPPVALALKWFRDEKYREYYRKKFHISLSRYGWRYKYIDIDGFLDESLHFDTYEAAESALLDDILTHIENSHENH